MRLRGIDDVVAVIDPVVHQPLDQVGRMLAVAVHEHHGAAAGMVEPGHQGGFLAEIARQRHHLHVERVGGSPRAMVSVYPRCRRRHRRPRSQARSAASACAPGRTAARAARRGRRPHCRAARRSTVPAPRRSPRSWTIRKHRYRASSIRFQTLGQQALNSICYLPLPVARMNEPRRITAETPQVWQIAGFPGPAHSPARRSKPYRRHGRAKSCRARRASPVGSAA